MAPPSLRFPTSVRVFERFTPDSAALRRWARTARPEADLAVTGGIPDP